MYEVTGNEEAKSVEYDEVLRNEMITKQISYVFSLLFRNIYANNIMIRIVCAISLNQKI